MSTLDRDQCAQIERDILVQYGEHVSFFVKGKPLNKFGRTDNADQNVDTTVSIFQGTAVNETYATGNTIDYVVSSDAGDTSAITVEGHYLDGANFVFVSKTVTLTGQTPVALPTPMVRANRAFNGNIGTIASPAADFVGNIAIYDSAAAGGVTGGVPNTAAATKLIIKAGEQQTQKCATTLSSIDYWAITGISAGVERASPATSNVDLEIQTRRIGGAWRPPYAKFQVSTGNLPEIFIPLSPCLIVQKNTDVRVVANASANDTIVHCTLFGRLGKVIENRGPIA